MLISLDSISKYHNEKCILKQVSYTIEERSKTALIGVNGTGKSTLLRILAGFEPYEEGVILRKKDSRLAYLPQDPSLDEHKTILEQVLSNAHADTSVFEAKAILGKLGIHQVNDRISILSGGQRKRVALAEVLLQDCDLLLLDEPTNHLDLDMIEWLENYLIKTSKALFMVTHDRYFMERITNRMVELDQGKLYSYEGNYDVYIEEKQRRYDTMRLQDHKRQSYLRKEWEWVKAGVKARGTKSKQRLQRFEQLQEVPTYKENDTMKVSAVSSRLGKKSITITDIGKRYDDKVLFQTFSYQMKRYERIGIIGKNGCGKSTLLHILAKEMMPDEGEIIYGETVKIGFFKQNTAALPQDKRVIDVIRDISDEIQTQDGRCSAAQMLEQFLFPRSMHYQKVSSLSGGEQRRLYLLSVLMGAPNILLLDEPTNDLDIDTLQVLENYLNDFCGGVFVVSHDRFFLDRICDSLFVFQANGQITTTIGGYMQYNEAKHAHDQAEPQSSKKEKGKRYRAPSLTSKEKQELAGMEQTIADLEAQIAQLDQEMNEASEDFERIKELSQQRTQTEQKLETTMNRWMELEEKQAALQ